MKKNTVLQSLVEIKPFRIDRAFIFTILLLFTCPSNIFCQWRISTTNPYVENQSEISNLTITNVAIWKDRTYVYFEYTSPYLKDGWISLSSKTTLTTKNSNVSLKIKEWGSYIKDAEKSFNELKFDTQYSVKEDWKYTFYMIFPSIPSGIENITIRENIGANEFYWDGIQIYNPATDANSSELGLLINTEDNRNIGVEIRDFIVRTGYTVIEEEIIEEDIFKFEIVEEKPKFMGGDESTFSTWINGKIEYPEVAKENGIQGRVMLTFVIDIDGRVVDVTVLRGVDPILDGEAVRAVQSSPRWTPGSQRDKPVKVRYNFPIHFQLR